MNDNKRVVVQVFGEPFWDRMIDRMVADTLNTRDEAEAKMCDCVGYLRARARMDNPNDTLVCNLGPDEAWHVFMLFSYQYRAFCNMLCATYLDHDPAPSARFVNSHEDTDQTVRLMLHHNIPFHPHLWMDHEMYPGGAEPIRGGTQPVRYYLEEMVTRVVTD